MSINTFTHVFQGMRRNPNNCPGHSAGVFVCSWTSPSAAKLDKVLPRQGGCRAARHKHGGVGRSAAVARYWFKLIHAA